jgi:hypothetical protein
MSEFDEFYEALEKLEGLIVEQHNFWHCDGGYYRKVSDEEVNAARATVARLFTGRLTFIESQASRIKYLGEQIVALQGERDV